VTVRGSVKRVPGGGLVIGKTKTAASRRERSLPKFAEKALRTRRIRQNEERFAAGERWQDLNLIITTAQGRLVSPTYITNTVFRRVCRRAGIAFSTRQHGGLRLHDLRHSAATMLGVAGHSESAIQKQLGHASAASTRRYRHVADEEMVAMAATMDRLVGGSGKV
jgi:integrase